MDQPSGHGRVLFSGSFGDLGQCHSQIQFARAAVSVTELHILAPTKLYRPIVSVVAALSKRKEKEDSDLDQLNMSDVYPRLVRSGLDSLRRDLEVSDGRGE